jgi:adenylylsulfate kinase-like enzyme
MIYWFTGQPGSGKTTLAKHLVTYLNNTTNNVIHIDGDDLRDIFQNKDYSEVGRRKNIERAQDISKFMDNKGYTVIVSLVSPYKDQREEFKKNNSVIEIYVTTNDIRGRENYHVKEYEPPTENFIKLDTTNETDVVSFIDLIKFLDI